MKTYAQICDDYTKVVKIIKSCETYKQWLVAAKIGRRLKRLVGFESSEMYWEIETLLKIQLEKVTKTVDNKENTK